MSSPKSPEQAYLDALVNVLRKRSSAIAVMKWLEAEGPRGALAARLHAMAREMLAEAEAETDSLKLEIEARGQ